MKKAKLIALLNCIRIHQYLEEWLVRARFHQTCLQHTDSSGWSTWRNRNWTPNSTHPRALADLKCKNQEISLRTHPSDPAADVPDMVTHSHSETSPPRYFPYNTHTVTLEKQLWVSESLEKEDNVLKVQPLHPLKHALQIFTDASKEGWDAHLVEHTARGT